jgi:phosphonate transport system substrate-binding protein
MVNGHCQRHPFGLSRRTILSGFAGLAAASPAPAHDKPEFTLGITPVFLDNDMRLLSLLQRYLTEQLSRPVRLLNQRTHREALIALLAGQLDAAWISDFLYVQFQDTLALLAVPHHRHQPLGQAYVIVNEAIKANTFDEIRGTVHAFSDPDSASGYLITEWLLALRRETPADFFGSFFFTYSHRNVARAVGNGLAESGSIEGYVWEMMKEREPELVDRTRAVFRSEWLGFPPIVAAYTSRNLPGIQALTAALLGMSSDTLGREILSILGLDGFMTVSATLYESTAEKWRVVKAQA